MYTGATSHIAADPGMISTLSPYSPIESVLVGNGNRIPVLGSGHSTINTSSKPFQLKDILYNPTFIKNLISVRKFSIDNYVSFEFDPFGFSVKDFQDGMLLSRHNSSGDLYPFTKDSSASTFVSTTSQF